MGDPEVIGSNVPNLMKNIPKFMKNVPKFVKDVPRVPNCVPRWGSAPNHFFMGSKIKPLVIHVQMGVPKVIGSNVPNFVKDVLKVPKFVSK